MLLKKQLKKHKKTPLQLVLNTVNCPLHCYLSPTLLCVLILLLELSSTLVAVPDFYLFPIWLLFPNAVACPQHCYLFPTLLLVLYCYLPQHSYFSPTLLLVPNTITCPQHCYLSSTLVVVPDFYLSPIRLLVPNAVACPEHKCFQSA